MMQVDLGFITSSFFLSLSYLSLISLSYPSLICLI